MTFEMQALYMLGGVGLVGFRQKFSLSECGVLSDLSPSGFGVSCLWGTLPIFLVF